jgi:hypothetical protein
LINELGTTVTAEIRDWPPAQPSNFTSWCSLDQPSEGVAWPFLAIEGAFALIAGVGYGSLTEAVEPEKPPRVSKTHMNEPQGLA